MITTSSVPSPPDLLSGTHTAPKKREVNSRVVEVGEGHGLYCGGSIIERVLDGRPRIDC